MFASDALAGPAPLPCPNCGCRMLARGQRGSPSLICADCGRPVDGPGMKAAGSRRWRSALLLLLLALLGIEIYIVTSLREGDREERSTTPGEVRE